MLARLCVLIALLAGPVPLTPARAAQPVAPPLARAAALAEELVLEGDNIITVALNGNPVRLEVSAEAFGPMVVNPEVAARLQLLPTSRRRWQFGPVVVEGNGAQQAVDFGAGPALIAVTWADRAASSKADGTIGVHHLPYARVTFVLVASAAGDTSAETTQRFALKRTGGSSNTRLGTEVTVGKKKLMMIFVPDRAENLITAPTANFIATHQEGGFEPGSDGVAVMNFAVERPTRIMRIAQPIELRELLIDRFAVRVEDYGEPRRVGEIGANDPRFEPGRILVSRRKGRGKPDLLTRLGRDQIAHCSRLTYDLEQAEIRLSCSARPE